MASSWVTMDWALARPDEVPPPELLAEGDEPELTDVLLELLELQAASVAAVAITAPDASRPFHLCVIAFMPSIQPPTRGCVNGSFLLRYEATMAKP